MTARSTLKTRPHLLRWFPIRNRLVFSYLLVVVLSSVIGVFLLVNTTVQMQHRLSVNRLHIYVVAVDWTQGRPDGVSNAERFAGVAGDVGGFGLIVADDEVLFSQGETPCRAGDGLVDCAPQWVDAEYGDRFFTEGGDEWWRKVETLVTGETLISQRRMLSTPIVGAGTLGDVEGYVAVALVFALGTTIFALPVAVPAAVITARLQTRRFRQLIRTSRALARGDLDARIPDPRPDLIGQLGQEINNMADATARNIQNLRVAAQRSTELGQHAESAAAEAERARVARNLHDSLAQQIFTISTAAGTIREAITNKPDLAAPQAKRLAALAENALLDMRAVLVELRPADSMERGFKDAVYEDCAAWSVERGIPVEVEIVLTGRYIPVSVTETLRHVVRLILDYLGGISTPPGVVQVLLVQGRQQITLSVTSDGGIFSTQELPTDILPDIIDMRERAYALGGDLQWEQAGERTTTMMVTIPLAAETVEA